MHRLVRDLERCGALAQGEAAFVQRDRDVATVEVGLVSGVGQWRAALSAGHANQTHFTNRTTT